MLRTLPAALLLMLPGLATADDDDFKPKDGRYSVRFPGRPKETTKAVTTPLGDQTVHLASYATGDGNVFLVSYTDYPAEAVKPENRATLYDGIRTGVIGKEGKVTADKEVTIDGEKGREVVVDKGKQVTRVRVVVKGTRLFQLMAVGTGEFVTGKDATKFFESFEFKK